MTERRDGYVATLGWTAAAFFSALVSAVVIGPLIPPAMMMPISIAVIAVLLITGFVRSLMTEPVAMILAILVPAAMGAITWPIVSALTVTGRGDVVVLSLAGTAVVFTAAAVIGWFSKVSLDSWAPKLMVIVFGMIAVGILNSLIFHLPMVSLLISIVALVVFTLYSFIDLQRVRDGRAGSPARAALNIFLDIFNIFTSLLNILSSVMR